MADYLDLAADQRPRAGKGAARAARRHGRVPAVIYGNSEDPILITVERRTLEQELNKPGFFTRLMDIRVNGDAHRVLPRDMQLHPVTDVPMHVDFLRYSADRKITVEIPVIFINEAECPGLRVGGVLNVVRHAIEVLCTADRIPESITFDLTGIEIGESMHASSITLPEGVEFTITGRDFTVATIAAPTLIPVEEEEVAEGEEGEEGVEGAAEGEEAAEGEAAEAPAEGEDKKKEGGA